MPHENVQDCGMNNYMSRQAVKPVLINNSKGMSIVGVLMAAGMMGGLADSEITLCCK